MISKCDRCTRIFKSVDEYNKHIKDNRCKEPYECKICNYITNRKSCYDNHINTRKCKDAYKIEEKKKLYECPDCNKSFRDNYSLSRHLNRKNTCNAPSFKHNIKSPINTSNTSNTSNNYIYIIQDRTAVQLNTNIYKIGKTKQSNLNRFKNYPKGYKIILLINCMDCDLIESKLIELFKEKYIQVKDYGNEYFQGNIEEMMKDIFQYSLPV